MHTIKQLVGNGRTLIGGLLFVVAVFELSNSFQLLFAIHFVAQVLLEQRVILLLQVFLFFIVVVLPSSLAGDLVFASGLLFDLIVDQVVDLFFICGGYLVMIN